MKMCDNVKCAANFLLQRKAFILTISNDMINFRQLKYALML